MFALRQSILESQSSSVVTSKLFWSTLLVWVVIEKGFAIHGFSVFPIRFAKKRPEIVLKRFGGHIWEGRSGLERPRDRDGKGKQSKMSYLTHGWSRANLCVFIYIYIYMYERVSFIVCLSSYYFLELRPEGHTALVYGIIGDF